MAQAKVKFTPDRAGILAAVRSEGVYRDLERRAERVKAAALAAYAPHRKTGEYGRSFVKRRLRPAGKASVRLRNTAPNAVFLEVGTQPHVIEARTKQALWWAGAHHPVRRVHHPGTPAYHLLRNALSAARG